MTGSPSYVCADGDRAEPRAQILEVARHREDRHDLGRGGDVEARLARDPVHLPAEPGHDLAQRAVVHVETAPPRDGERVDAERVPLEDVRVEHRGEEVVRGGDRVEVAGEVEVEILHRHDLRVTAAGRAALHAEDGAERRLAQAEERLLVDRREALRERDGGRRLPLARRRRRDRRDGDELAVGRVGEAVEDGVGDLRLVAAVRLELVLLDAGGLGDFGDRPQLGGLRDFKTREFDSCVECCTDDVGWCRGIDHVGGAETTR